MKTIIWGLAFVFIFVTVSFAKTYKAKTKDYEVEKMEDVQIEITETKDHVSFGCLKDYDHLIIHAQEQIDFWDAEIIRFRDERILIETEAKKVKLKEIDVLLIK